MISLVETVNRMAQKMTSGGVRIYHGTSYCSVPQLTVQAVNCVINVKINEELNKSFFFMKTTSDRYAKATSATRTTRFLP